ncbi:hypothetical protein BDZ89DRAFT_1060163, partial [Hymenopellis radicata]
TVTGQASRTWCSMPILAMRGAGYAWASNSVNKEERIPIEEAWIVDEPWSDNGYPKEEERIVRTTRQPEGLCLIVNRAPRSACSSLF